MPIQVNELSKQFRLFKREAGLSGALRSFFNRKYENFHALTDISVKIEDGDTDEVIVETSKAKGEKCPVCWKISSTPCERHKL